MHISDEIKDLDARWNVLFPFTTQSSHNWKRKRMRDKQLIEIACKWDDESVRRRYRVEGDDWRVSAFRTQHRMKSWRVPSVKKREREEAQGLPLPSLAVAILRHGWRWYTHESCDYSHLVYPLLGSGFGGIQGLTFLKQISIKIRTPLWMHIANVFVKRNNTIRRVKDGPTFGWKKKNHGEFHFNLRGRFAITSWNRSIYRIMPLYFGRVVKTNQKLNSSQYYRIFGSRFRQICKINT